MVLKINKIVERNLRQIKCKEVIISGGITGFLDGHYLIKKCKLNSVYGQASAMLKKSLNDYEPLRSYLKAQINGLKISETFLKVKE